MDLLMELPMEPGLAYGPACGPVGHCGACDEAMLDRAVEAANEADADLAPRHIAMLCQGLSAAQAKNTGPP